MLKPRGIRHVFWNVGPEPANFKEIFTHAGFEHIFEEFGRRRREGEALDFEAVKEIGQPLRLDSVHGLGPRDREDLQRDDRVVIESIRRAVTADYARYGNPFHALGEIDPSRTSLHLFSQPRASDLVAAQKAFSAANHGSRSSGSMG